MPQLHLTGELAESIERLEPEFENVPALLHWQAGRMAAQLRNQDDKDEIADIDEWLKVRIEILLSFPEETFFKMDEFLQQQNDSELFHYFNVSIDLNGGLSFLPNEEEAGDKDLPPARFPVHSALNRITKAIYRKLD